MITLCKSCGTPILWIKTENGKNMPCNGEETTVVTLEGEIVKGHVSHFATCPQAKDWRKKK